MSFKYEESSIFPVPESVGNRPWGREDLLGLIPKQFSLKRLEIQRGNKGGLQYHRLKDEIAVVVSGKLLVRYDLGDGILKERIVGPGETVHFPPGLVHQEEAITDCVLIEASTPHFNDRVRVEEKYGLGKPQGMQTTTENEIELR